MRAAIFYPLVALAGLGVGAGMYALNVYRERVQRAEMAAVLPAKGSGERESPGGLRAVAGAGLPVTTSLREAVKGGREAQAIAAGSPMIDDVPRGKDRHVHAPPVKGEVREMTIKELGNFEFDPEVGGGVPADVKGLNGSTVRLRGYMLPLTQAEKITDLALVPSLYACCFGQPPGVEHVVTVRIPKDKAVNFVVDEVVITGKLTVEELREDEFSYSLFELDAVSVRLAE